MGSRPGASVPYTGSNVPPQAAAAVGNDPQAPQDTVHAMMRPGEQVVDEDTAKWYGQKFFADLATKAKKARQNAPQPSYAAMQPEQLPPVSYVSQGIPA